MQIYFGCHKSIFLLLLIINLSLKENKKEYIVKNDLFDQIVMSQGGEHCCTNKILTFCLTNFANSVFFLHSFIKNLNFSLISIRFEILAIHEFINL